MCLLTGRPTFRTRLHVEYLPDILFPHLKHTIYQESINTARFVWAQIEIVNSDISCVCNCLPSWQKTSIVQIVASNRQASCACYISSLPPSIIPSQSWQSLPRRVFRTAVRRHRISTRVTCYPGLAKTNDVKPGLKHTVNKLEFSISCVPLLLSS